MITIERRKCCCTATGLRSVLTTTPPTTACPKTPITSETDNHVRSRRRGTRTSEPSTANATAITTMPVNRRLTCSIAPCPVDTSTKCCRLQFGQSAQPRPESVRRTSAPVTTMTHRKTSAASVTFWYVAGWRRGTAMASRA